MMSRSAFGRQSCRLGQLLHLPFWLLPGRVTDSPARRLAPQVELAQGE